MKILYLVSILAASATLPCAALTPGEVLPLVPDITAEPITASTIEFTALPGFQTPAQHQGAMKAETTDQHVWNVAESGQFTDNIVSAVFSVENRTYTVDVVKDKNNPAVYAIRNAYGPAFPYYTALGQYGVSDNTTRYMVFDTTDPDNVILEKTPMGITDGQTEFYVASYSWLEASGIINAGTCERLGLKGSLKDGKITFPTAGSLFIFTEASLAQGKGHNANKDGLTALLLPGAKDYSLSVTGWSWCPYSESSTIAAATAGADVSTIIMGCSAAPDTEAGIQEVLDNHVVAENGKGAFVPMPLNPLAPNQKTYIVAIGLDAAGKAQAVALFPFYAFDNSDDWTTLDGKGMFNDYLVSHAYGYTTSPYEVTVQESKSRPGYYRIVDPFKNTRNNTRDDQVHGTHAHYIYLDATDPDCVILEESPIGYITANDGDCRIKSKASDWLAQGKSRDEIKQANAAGVLSNGKITWPFTAYIFMGFLVEGGDYWMNVNFTVNGSNYAAGPTYLQLPAAGVESAVAADSDAPVHYYNLQGSEITNPAPGSVVIRRQGTSVSKIFVR